MSDELLKTSAHPSEEYVSQTAKTHQLRTGISLVRMTKILEIVVLWMNSIFHLRTYTPVFHFTFLCFVF